jgi:hypothetical protein
MFLIINHFFIYMKKKKKGKNFKSNFFELKLVFEKKKKSLIFFNYIIFEYFKNFCKFSIKKFNLRLSRVIY